jgi:TRAP transporter 4TM/12TM fusion protein
MDWVIGVVTVVLVFEAARRVMGWGLPLICATFLAYALFGEHLPGALAHRGYGLDQIVSQLGFGTEGIYGTPTYVSSTYIFLFILFGAFLEQAGMIRLFNDFAMGTVGHTRGGPAKVSVISSGLMGTINGSGVANVVTTGQFTIPLMKRFGYSPAFAGGVEATASMGGQIMPPVMGAVAFIMAETLNVAYAEVVTAAIVPAVLYFGACFWQVHLEAGKAGLAGMDKATLPNPWTAVRLHWPLVLPLAALVYLLFAGYTPIFAGTMGLALTVVLILGTPLAALIGPYAFRVVFWIALGLAAAAFMRFGVNVLALVLAALVAACPVFKGGRETLAICRDSLAEGAKNALPVGIACAIVGIVIGTLTLTGIASTLIGAIIDIGENNLFLSLVLTMLTCLVLGMGIPTIPNYIITSSLAGPALLELGVPLLVSHMFVFYFGIMADLTPPVALAAYAAAPMAKESGLRIGIQAVKLALAGFVVPFMAVYTPALMLQDAGPLSAYVGYWGEVAYVIAKACVAIALWGAAVVGFLFGRMATWERAAAFSAGALLMLALPLTDEAGWALAVLVIGQHWWRTRAAAPRPA